MKVLSITLILVTLIVCGTFLYLERSPAPEAPPIVTETKTIRSEHTPPTRQNTQSDSPPLERAYLDGVDSFTSQLTSTLQQDPEAAFLQLAEIDLRVVPPSTVSAAYLKFYEDDLVAGLEGFQVFGEKNSLLADLLPQYAVAYAKQDSDAALTWCLENPDLVGIPHALHALGKEYSYATPTAPLIEKVLSSELEDGSKASYLSGLLGGWLDEAPDEALTEFATLPSSPVMDDVIIDHIETISKLDPAAAQSWASYIENEEDREYALKLIK